MEGRGRKASMPEGEYGERKRRRASSNSDEDEMENVKDSKETSTGGGSDTKTLKPEAAAGSGGEKVHPLLIDHVLEKILQYVIPKTGTTSEDQESSASVVKNIQNLRLVCKQWKDLATSVYRRNRAPMMTFGRTWEARIICPPPNTNRLDEKMQNFLDVMKSSKLIPFERYTIHPEIFVKANQQLMEDFMRLCGPDAVEIHLSCDNSNTVEFNPTTFRDLNLRKLKTLSFKCEHHRHFSRQTYEIAYFIGVLLTAAETLREFKFTFESGDFSPRRDCNWAQGIIKNVGEFISKQMATTVKTFSLHGSLPVSDLHLATLAERGLKLEELQLDGMCVVSTKGISKFFETQAPTLKVLKIFDADKKRSLSSSLSFADFPRFDELLHLELNNAGNTQQLSYPEKFPKLTTLNITEWKTRSPSCATLLTPAKKGLSLSLKEIHLPYGVRLAPLVKKAAKCFPNISKLHLTPSKDISEALQEVFVYFANIEELYLTMPCEGRFNADSIFSGVSQQDCERIEDHHNFEFDGVNIKDVQHRPSILNLTKLKKLVLVNCQHDGCGGITLTDFCAHFVFLKLASLNELHTNRFKMSTEYVDLLQEKLNLELTGSDYYSDTSSENSFPFLAFRL